MPFQGTLVRSVCPYISPVSGTVFGVEIEAEGRNIPRPDFSPHQEDYSDEESEYKCQEEFMPGLIPSGWMPEKEDSLRGEGCEYVFEGPMGLEDSIEALNRLREMFIKADSHLNRDSTRTSTHVHVNVSDFLAGNLGTFLTTYLLMEEMLFELLPPIRQRNLFCLRTRHAPATLLFWRKLFGGNPSAMDNTNLRYSALSVQSLFKYGTLEFRGGQGPSMDDDYWMFIKNMLRFFANIRETSISNPNPVAYLEEVASRGPYAFYAENFYPYFGAVPGVSEFRLFEKGMVSARTLVGDIDWEEPQSPLSAFDAAESSLEPVPAVASPGLTEYAEYVEAQLAAHHSPSTDGVSLSGLLVWSEGLGSFTSFNEEYIA